jgi:hypothetical protein
MADNQNLFDQALAAARQKDFASARTLLKQLLKEDPTNLDAWLLGAHVVESPSDAIRCYERVLQIDPNHAYAQKQLSELKSQMPPAPAAPASSSGKAPAQPVAASPSRTAPPKAESVSPTPRSKTAIGMIVLAVILLGVCGLMVVLVAVFSAGGLSLAFQPTPNDKQLLDVLYENARAANAEDIDAYMATIHPSSSMYNQTKTTLPQVFATYDLDFKVYDLKVTDQTATEARVHFALLTRKRSGPDFRNNIVTGTMILRPDHGAWKIYNQVVDNVQY